MKNFMLKKNMLICALISVLLLTVFAGAVPAAAKDNWEHDYFTYGSGLSLEQLEETERLIGVPQDDSIKRLMVNGADFEKYTGVAAPDSNLYSSTVISKEKPGTGTRVYINTPDNITQIKDHQYMNAAITAGIKDVTIIVGSPIPVTGETALVGVYKALEDAGYPVNTEATKIATDELIVINEISQDNKENPGFDSENFSKAIADIKEQISEISDKESLNADNIIVIINNVLNDYQITISDSDKEKLADWLEQFKSLNIDWDSVKNELSGLGDLISEKVDEIYRWGQESGFFEKIWQAIKEFFSSLFNR